MIEYLRFATGGSIIKKTILKMTERADFAIVADPAFVAVATTAE
jgi:hypothetical protein